MAIPHSNPVSTVFTSSLNLFKDVMLPFEINSSSSLISLTWLSLVILPDSTCEPAIKPILGILNDSLTTATPITSSTKSGFNRPSTASFMSSTTWYMIL